MAVSRSFVHNMFSFPLLSLILLISRPKQVAALSNMEGVYIAGAIFLLFLVVDIFLIVFLISWIRSEMIMKDYYAKKEMIRQRSIECLESDVRLQLRRKTSYSDNESFSEETSFDEVNKVNSEVQEKEGNDIRHEVFVETETVRDSKSFEERRKEAQLARPNNRTESESPLILGDVNVEETLKPAQLVSVIEKPNSLPPEGKKIPHLQRLQSSDYRRDNKAPLIENEINVNGVSPPTSPVQHLPIEEEEEELGDVKLVSLASRITGPIIPTDSPPHSIPNEIKSLDVSAISGTNETSFNDDPLHSTSGTSIGWSNVFELIKENNANVEDTINLHTGQLAQESFIAMSKESYNFDSNTSMNSDTHNISASCPAPNHERAFSYDNHERTASFDKSFPPYLTPQHVVPRPRGRSNPGQTSLSLTNSPAHKKL